MTEKPVEITAMDGLALAGTVFAPVEPNGAVLIINPATGVRQRLYGRYAQFMANEGFTVVTYDYRGMGGSQVPPDVWRRIRIHDWGIKDAAGVVAWSRRELAPGRLFVCGHSIGGQLIATLEQANDIDAVLLVAAQSGFYAHWPLRGRWQLWLLWHVAMPLVTRLMGRFPGRLLGGASEDLPPLVARDWARWCRSPHYLVDDAGAPIRIGARRYAGPLLALSFSDDATFAPKKAVAALLDWFEGADIDWRHLTPAEAGVEEIGHFKFFRDQALRPLWQETADWLRRSL